MLYYVCYFLRFDDVEQELWPKGQIRAWPLLLLLQQILILDQLQSLDTSLIIQYSCHKSKGLCGGVVESSQLITALSQYYILTNNNINCQQELISYLVLHILLTYLVKHTVHNNVYLLNVVL